MGKHERGTIREAERIITRILNSQSITRSDRKNPWFKHSIEVANKIKTDFPKITSATHLGDRYDSVGDIVLNVIPDGRIFVEVKMSDTKSGTGTKANISQDSLTESELFVDRVKSWSQFRSENNHWEWVEKYLDGFKKYPRKVLSIKNKLSRIEAKARFLRNLKDLRKRGHRNAAKILNSIQSKDRREKTSYLNYLKSKKQNYKRIGNFLVLIMLGIHRQDKLKSLIKKANLFKEAEKSVLYYSNVNKGKILVRKEDIGERVKKNIV